MNEIATVPVKSSWTSKVNWTMIAGILFNIIAFFGIPVDEGTKSAIIAGASALFFLLGAVFRTWFSPGVTKASIGR